MEKWSDGVREWRNGVMENVKKYSTTPILQYSYTETQKHWQIGKMYDHET